MKPWFFVGQQGVFVVDVELEYACLSPPSLVVVDVGVVHRQAVFKCGTKTSFGMEFVTPRMVERLNCKLNAMQARLATGDPITETPLPIYNCLEQMSELRRFA